MPYNIASAARSVPATFTMFELFDPKEPYVVTKTGKLPHWYQPGVTYFVTFRTDDSVPQALLQSWYSRRATWLRDHEIDPKNTNWKIVLAQSPNLDREFHSLFSIEFMNYLDRGYGECALKKPTIAKIVADALLHFDGARYQLGDFVIMPNHVHLLVCLTGKNEMTRQCESWKRFTARVINRLLGRKGRFWQEESFDHLVRSAEQFEHLKQYIADNPKKANLRDGEFLHWARPRS